jgi:hypothetical protein
MPMRILRFCREIDPPDERDERVPKWRGRFALALLQLLVSRTGRGKATR